MSGRGTADKQSFHPKRAFLGCWRCLLFHARILPPRRFFKFSFGQRSPVRRKRMICHLILHYRDGRFKDVASGSFPQHWNEPIFLPFAKAFSNANMDIPPIVDRIVFERRGKAKKGKTSLYANYYEIERPKNPILEAENRAANKNRP